MKYVTPSISETAFNCPHCGALASQGWTELRGRRRSGKDPLSLIIRPEAMPDFSDVREADKRAQLVSFAQAIASGTPVFGEDSSQEYGFTLYNVNVSTCFNCRKHAVWIHEKLAYPLSGEAPPANPDMSDDIRADYNEANAILDVSPRGAAALIRLCIQKLCKEQGQPGKNINEDIGKLVALGLDKRIQQALDAVRVIGNQAVHPGQMDLKDDRATAMSLFKLLNLIVDKLVSEPKHIEEVYNTLPKGQLEAIERRDQGKE